MDGNFKADHLQMVNPDDVFLSDGLRYFVGKDDFEEHLTKSKYKSPVCYMIYLQAFPEI